MEGERREISNPVKVKAAFGKVSFRLIKAKQSWKKVKKNKTLPDEFPAHLFTPFLHADWGLCDVLPVLPLSHLIFFRSQNSICECPLFLFFVLHVPKVKSHSGCPKAAAQCQSQSQSQSRSWSHMAPGASEPNGKYTNQCRIKNTHTHTLRKTDRDSGIARERGRWTEKWAKAKNNQ